MMRAVYLPAASCWRVTFGDSLCDIRGVWHWTTRRALAESCRRAGLTLSPSNVIEAAP